MASTYYNASKGVWETVVHMGKGVPRKRFTGATAEEAQAKMAAAFPDPVVPVIGPHGAPGLDAKPNLVTVTGKVGQPLEMGDIGQMMRKYGLNPDDWQVERTVVNEWAGYHQLKVTLVPRLHMLLPSPARLDGPKYTTVKPVAGFQDSELVVILPDQQIPFQDDNLHQLVCDWLSYNKPDRMILSGDFYDFPSISRHPTKAHELKMGGVQECLDTGYRIARDYVDAAGPTCHERIIIPGNHEFRIQKFLLETVPQLFNLRRAADPETERLLSLAHLSRLDELGFTWAKDPVYEEDYPQGHVMLGGKLAVYHGWVARSKSGESALKTLEHLGHSVVVGHTHRQADVAHTFHESNGQLRTLRGVEAGTLARVRGGLGYTVAPNWQPGFVTVRLFPNGLFNIELAKYVNGVLIWGDQTYGKQRPTKRRLEAVA